MTGKILINAGPSRRGWLWEQLTDVIMTGAVSQQDVESTVRDLFSRLPEVGPPPGACCIPLTQGKWATVDDDDFDNLITSEWSASRRVDGSFVAVRGSDQELMHRVICPDAPLVDHVNGNTLDNRRENLRSATYSQNGANSKRKGKQPHGFKGIYYSKHHRKKWQAQIKVKYKAKNLGGYDTPEEAARAYDKAATYYFGEFARLNFPLEGR